MINVIWQINLQLHAVTSNATIISPKCTILNSLKDQQLVNQSESETTIHKRKDLSTRCSCTGIKTNVSQSVLIRVGPYSHYMWTSVHMRVCLAPVLLLWVATKHERVPILCISTEYKMYWCLVLIWQTHWSYKYG